MNELLLLWDELVKRVRQKTKAARAFAHFTKKKEDSIFWYFSRSEIPKGKIYWDYVRALQTFLKKYPNEDEVDKYLIYIGELPVGYVSEWSYMNKNNVGYAEVTSLKKKYPNDFLIFHGMRYMKENLKLENAEDPIDLQKSIEKNLERLSKFYPSKIDLCIAIAPKIGMPPQMLRDRLFKCFRISEKPRAKSLNLYKKVLPVLQAEIDSHKALKETA